MQETAREHQFPTRIANSQSLEDMIHIVEIDESALVLTHILCQGTGVPQLEARMPGAPPRRRWSEVLYGAPAGEGQL